MISEQFKSAVQSKNMERVKIMLKNSLTQDLTFKQFQTMLDYALKNLPDLIESHDGTEFGSKTNWDKQYASAIKVDLVDNFSKERIAHIKEVQSYVYADEILKQNQAERTKASNNSKGNIHNNQESIVDHDLQAIVKIIAATGVAAVAVVAFCLFKGLTIVTVATSTAIASCVVGGVTYYFVRKSS